MPLVNLFLLLPESEPTNQWMASNGEFVNEEMINRFVVDLSDSIKAIELENYIGYFDIANIQNFGEVFNELEEFYPASPSLLIKLLLKDWENWRDKSSQSNEKNYCIFNQVIQDHSICEIAARINKYAENNHALFNYYALSFQDDLDVKLEDKTNIVVNILNSRMELFEWFAENRLPQRNFHIIPKHGENQQNVKIENNKLISPLRCSCQVAQEFLKTAIGESERELFNFDPNKNEFIVFKFEGDTPQNMYHGYHIPISSVEIPNHIKKRLLEN